MFKKIKNPIIMKTRLINELCKISEMSNVPKSGIRVTNYKKSINFLKTKTFLIVFILLLSSFAVTNPSGKVKGVVVSEGKETVVASAQVAFYFCDKEVWSFNTSTDGIFSTSLPSGKYTVKVTANGFKPYINRNVNIPDGSTIYLKVVLKKDGENEKDKGVKTVKDVEETVTTKNMEKRACGKAEQYGYYAPAAAEAGLISNYDEVYVEHNTESYNVINENIFKDVINNPLSTFSIDVDKASYSNVRRYLTQNQKPPKDAVRIEELINYFDYDYPQPKDEHPFSVNIEHEKCPWNEKNELVLIGLKGENINEKEIPACNLVFLLDVSGSMDEPNKLPLIKQSFKYLINNLRPEDKVAIVVYAGAAGVILESTPGSEKNKITTALNNLQAGGSTAGGEGITLAYKIAKQNFIPNGNNRVILATDGDFNIGASSDAEMVRLIESKRDDGIFLTILGFGMGNYKDSKMVSLADAGNGNYGYVDNILEAKKMFGTELWGTLYTIAKDVKIQVEFNPAYVKAYRLIGYEKRLLNKEDFNNDKKDAGEIGCGHSVTALYEVVPAGSDQKVSDVDPLEYQKAQVVDSKYAMTVKLRYKKPNEDKSILMVEKYKPSGYTNSNNINFAAAVAQFGMLLRDSEFKGTANWTNVIKMAKEAKGVDEFGYRNDFIKMIEMAEMLADK